MEPGPSLFDTEVGDVISGTFAWDTESPLFSMAADQAIYSPPAGAALSVVLGAGPLLGETDSLWVTDDFDGSGPPGLPAGVDGFLVAGPVGTPSVAFVSILFLDLTGLIYDSLDLPSALDLAGWSEASVTLRFPNSAGDRSIRAEITALELPEARPSLLAAMVAMVAAIARWTRGPDRA